MIRKNTIAYVIAAIMLMETIDGSALNTALPQIAQSFAINAVTLKMTITIYLLTLGLFIPASAWITDKIGMKKVLLISVSGFTVSSIFCGLSSSLETLVIARMFQGFFGAFTVPVARLVISRIFKNDLLHAMSIIAFVASMGPVLGPIVGGALTTFLSWRYIFYINIPIGIIVIFCIFRIFPSLDEYFGTYKKFDIVGFLFLGGSIVLFMLLLEVIIEYRIAIYFKLILLVAAMLLSGLYFLHAKLKKSDALISLDIFSNIAFRRLIIISILFRLSIFGLMFLIPLYLQTKQGFSAFQSGLVFLAFVLASALIRRNIEKFKNKYGVRQMLMFCLLQVVVGYFVISYSLINFDIYLLVMGLIILGLVFGIFATLTNSCIYASVSDNQVGECSVIASCVIQLTGAFAIAWVAIALILLSGIKGIDASTNIPNITFALILLLCSIIAMLAFAIVFKTPKKYLRIL